MIKQYKPTQIENTLLHQVSVSESNSIPKEISGTHFRYNPIKAVTVYKIYLNSGPQDEDPKRKG
jgi:hypothetical protein